MNMIDTALIAAWDADLPPARDAMFRIAVIERLERRRYQQNIILVILAGLGATTLLGLLGVQVAANPQIMGQNSMTPLIIAAAAGLLALGWGLQRAFKVV